jgi:hypothetical protein
MGITQIKYKDQQKAYQICYQIFPSVISVNNLEFFF